MSWVRQTALLLFVGVAAGAFLMTVMSLQRGSAGGDCSSSANVAAHQQQQQLQLQQHATAMASCDAAREQLHARATSCETRLSACQIATNAPAGKRSAADCDAQLTRLKRQLDARPSAPVCPKCDAPAAAAAAPAAPAAPATPPMAATDVQQCKALFAKHNIEGDNMKEQLEIDGLLYLLRTYCGHGDGLKPGLVDFPETQPHTHVLEIGANKGFSLWNYFQLWGDFADTMMGTVAKRRPYAGHSGGKVTVHAFEPLASVYAILESVRAHFEPLGMSRLITHHSAVSNFTGQFTLTAPTSEESTELAGLAMPGQRRNQRANDPGVEQSVSVTTVDSIVAVHNIARVIHMKVDTEGNDGRVVFGADRTLRNGVITSAVLEYERSAWADVYGTPLKAVVEFLSDRGYDSYFLAGSTLIRLSGSNAEWWQRSFDDTKWSNIWVSRRSSACARKTVVAFAAKTDLIPAACYA